MPADPTKAKVVSQWKHESPLIACRIDPKGRFVVTTAEDNGLQRWDLPGGNKLAFAAHDSWVFSLAFTPDGETLVSGGGDGRLIWWNNLAAQPTVVRKVDAHLGWIRQIAVSPDGKLLASAGNDQKVKIWNIADGALVKEFVGHENQVYSTLFHPQGASLLSGDLLGFVRQWDVATGMAARTFEAKDLHSYNGGQGVHFGGIRAMAFNRDAKLLACGGLFKAENPLGAVHEPLAVVFDWESLKVVQSHVAEGMKGSLWRLLYHPDGFLMGVSGGSSGGFLIFWKPENPKEFHRFALPNVARDMDLHPDGLQVATTHYDRHLRISTLQG